MRKALVFTLALVAALPLAGRAAEPVEATIVRDKWGVPHIYADDAYSLFFANGYAQAQDRMAQMEILRHVGKGRLAELTGPSGLALDLVTRRELYTEEERARALARLPEQWRDAFEAFAAGVNRWIGEIRLDPTKLPVEYPALVAFPEDWKATDTVAIAQYLLDVFGRGGGGQEVANAKILGRLRATVGTGAAEAALTDLAWVQRDETYTTIKPEDAAPWPTPEAEYPHDLSSLPADQLEAIAAAQQAEVVDDAAPTLFEASVAAGMPFRLGSNAQLIDERFTANGKPLLFGGPQMAYFNPMIPYELSLHGAGFDAAGMGVAGAPGVIIGRAANQSWTVTSGSSDQVDLVVERLTDAQHYELNGVEQAMDCRTETHIVRPGPADIAASPSDPPKPDIVQQEVCRTIHGPVIYRTEDGRYAIASQRSYRGDEVRSGSLWLGVGQTKTRQEFQDQFQTFRFEFNFNYVNEDGDLMYMHVGRQPLRDARLDPRLPRPGWDTSYEWKGFLEGSQLPHVINPASGYTVNWNNNPAVGWPSGDIREQWGSLHRAQLMDGALKPVLEGGGLTMDDLREVNEFASTHEPFAGAFADLMRDAAVATDETEAIGALDEWREAKFDWADRNGDGSHDFRAFRLYELWRDGMQKLVFSDELGEHVRRLNWDPATSDDPHAADHGNTDNKHTILAQVIAGGTTHDWCDDVTTDDAETCLQQSTRALEEALAGDWESPFPMRQSTFVALGAGEAHQIPMTNRPSFQHFYDWGVAEGPERSRNALPPGASGHLSTIDFASIQIEDNGGPSLKPRPPHIADQLQMYVDFGDKPLLFAGTLADWASPVFSGFEEGRITLAD